MVKLIIKRIFIITFLLYNVSITSSAYMVDHKKLSSRLLYIQVGAFTQQKSIDEMRKRLRRFPLWIEDLGNLKRVYVVSNPKYKSAMFRKVRKLVPDAFIRKNRKNIPFLLGKSKSLNSINVQVDQIDLSTPLDSKAILQTRKKFF